MDQYMSMQMFCRCVCHFLVSVSPYRGGSNGSFDAPPEILLPMIDGTCSTEDKERGLLQSEFLLMISFCFTAERKAERRRQNGERVIPYSTGNHLSNIGSTWISTKISVNALQEYKILLSLYMELLVPLHKEQAQYSFLAQLRSACCIPPPTMAAKAVKAEAHFVGFRLFLRLIKVGSAD